MDYFNIINNTIDTIENNLDSMIFPKKLAEEAHLSQFHFFRIFKGILGYSVMEYVRYRRMSCAAEKLLNSEISILEIALKYDFNSQEAFTRSFKKIFGCTPGKYRRGNTKIEVLQRITLWGLRYKYNNFDKKVNYEIVELNSFTVVGIQCNTMLKDGTNYKEIDILCKKLEEKISKLVANNIIMEPNKRRIGVTFPVTRDFKSPYNNSFTYLRGIESNEIEKMFFDMVSTNIPKCNYIKFACSNNVKKHEETLDYIFGICLPGLQLDLSKKDIVLLEVFTGKSICENEKELEIYVPLE